MVSYNLNVKSQCFFCSIEYKELGDESSGQHSVAHGTSLASIFFCMACNVRIILTF